MFGLFKTKLDFDDEKKARFVNAISDMLEIQRMPAVNCSIEDSEGRINRKAIGYVYGFIDAALQAIGQDMRDIAVGMPMMYHVLKRLYPGREEHYTKFLYDQIGKDEVIMLGIMTGGEQYVTKVGKVGQGVPMKFGMFLLEGDKH